jgi:hypothetical protein
MQDGSTRTARSGCNQRDRAGRQEVRQIAGLPDRESRYSIATFTGVPLQRSKRTGPQERTDQPISAGLSQRWSFASSIARVNGFGR